MFRCQATGKVSKSREKPVRIIVETRPQQYENRYKDEETLEWVVVRTEGTEIVKELLVCQEYFDSVKVEK